MLEKLRNELPNVEMMKDVDPESLIPLLPDIVRSARNNLHSYPVFSIFPLSLEKEKQVKDFFSLFSFTSAVPVMLTVLGDPQAVPIDEIIGEPQTTIENKLNGWDDEGTNGWSKGQSEDSVQVTRRTLRMDDPVAEGFKIALLKIGQSDTLLKNKIDQAIRDFDNHPRRTHLDTKEVILDSKILWSKHGSWK
jgi:hypothetical protein